MVLATIVSQSCRAGRRAQYRAASSVACVLLAALVLFMAPAFAAPSYPELTGRVTDEAGLLNADDRAAIEAASETLEKTSTDQLAVVIVKSLQGYPIEDYGIGLARKWGIGQKGKDNGILLIVAPNDRKVRIEVGRRLEPFMTDTMSALIIQNSILPKFRRGDYAGGIRDAVRDIKDVVLGDADEVKRRSMGPRTPEDDPTLLIHILLWVAIIAFVIWMNNRQLQKMQQANQNGSRRRGRGGVVILPGGSSDWGGSWSSGGGGDSGGSWSGGGGDFGGGGASGSW